MLFKLKILALKAALIAGAISTLTTLYVLKVALMAIHAQHGMLALYLCAISLVATTLSAAYLYDINQREMDDLRDGQAFPPANPSTVDHP